MNERDEYLLAHQQYQRDFSAGWNLLARAFSGTQRYSGLYQFDGVGNFSTGSSEWAGGELRLLFTGFARHKLMLGSELQ